MKAYFNFLMFQILFILFFLFPIFLIPSVSFAVNDNKPVPALLLANIYQPGIKLEDYWVSEKLDGVRAYWDGKHLISRQGNIFHAPEWFISPLPLIALDGELWLGRERFEEVSGQVRRQTSNNFSWKNIKFMVFDLPGDAQNFDGRLKQLKKVINKAKLSHLKLIKQYKILTHEVLENNLDSVVKQGAEGLMLHLGSSFYKSGRSSDLLKLKKHFDAEAIVIKHYQGKRKYKGMLGSLLVETVDKKQFKIGSGFSDAERKNPPPVGSVITYKYFGLTKNGIPRFASFMRIRNKH